ncbi:MAG: transcriptional regulator [Microbacterium sp. 71-36]|uniref:LacI family DNA-binding transcriptional regulator n=1 Tax=unclassified Microbacterium TaxID=2609290 RepID=UPI00086D7BBB|nr:MULTISPECIES: LacI family DNA-binding transcriptional regulator [unclassified Microbacterium]MBN9211623.1 LacI family DNA-binding transcriptional regulator [Microbacterium sp.]ODT36773.1 MAG: transcriptional regulator [Microbacterium sp. SCN 71-17]OJV77526.1 MAG: transcriptional regulator [Microbacterium sp. 71-36]SIS08847.1 transcriptional regulator, LacI family [Microbacterium sp. RURRCA19A]
MTKAPTVEDVARVAGVSRQTVSNVVNTPGIVREATRLRVEAAIAELGYRPHAAARRLRTRRSSTIGIHLDPYAGGIAGVVLDRFVHALTERASERDMRVLLYAARTAEEEIDRLGDLLEGGEVDAVVVTGTFHGDPRTGWLNERGLPFVSFGRPWGEDDVAAPAHLWVDVDGAAGTRAATEHLLAGGARRVAFLGWPAGSGTGDERERGWRESVGAAAGPRWVVEDNVALARDVLAEGLARDPEVDGIVCASDSLAIGAHLAAAVAGRADIPVIGFDNTPAAEALGLSSVEQLPERVASGALDLLMGESGTVVAPRPATAGAAHVLVEPRLVVR